MRKNTIERADQWFWSRLNKQGTVMNTALGPCWEWEGFRLKDGYGHVRFLGNLELTHRVAWILTHGSATKDICHKCDNPPCSRPDHLFEGTQSENTLDAVKKGRQGKIGMELAVKIRGMRHLGRIKLAEQFGVSHDCISMILNNKTYVIEDTSDGK